MLGKIKTFMSDHRGSVVDTIHVHLQTTLLFAVGLRTIMRRHMYQVHAKVTGPVWRHAPPENFTCLYVHRVCSKLGKWSAYLQLLLVRLEIAWHHESSYIAYRRHDTRKKRWDSLLYTFNRFRANVFLCPYIYYYNFGKTLLRNFSILAHALYVGPRYF